MITDEASDLFGSASATFDDTRTYRYRLVRRWGDGPVMVMCMLNPSTADAFELDPTIRRCLTFATREGCAALAVVNLYALRATDPAALRTHSDPVGPDNDAVLRDAFAAAAVVVAAWGANGPPSTTARRASQVRALLLDSGVTPMCLGVTKGGHPRHPLYVRGDAPLVPYRPPGETV